MTTAEQLADEIYGLYCDIGRLEQENARLRKLIYDRAHEHAIQHMTEDELRIMVANVMDENTKLRGLLADLAICVCGKYCYGCPHQYDGCDRDERLRKLGVDV